MDRKLHNSIIVLKALMRGLPVKIKDYTYFLDTENNLCIEGIQYDSSNPERKESVLLKVDYSLSNFLNMCEKDLTEEEIFLITANSVLNSEKNLR